MTEQFHLKVRNLQNSSKKSVEQLDDEDEITTTAEAIKEAVTKTEPSNQ